MARWISERVILLMWLVAFAWPVSAWAQGVETRGAQSPAIIAGGDVAVTYGFTSEQVRDLSCFQQVAPVLEAVGLIEESKMSDRMVGRLQDGLAKSAATPGNPPKPGG